MSTRLPLYSRIFWVSLKNNYVAEAVYRSNFLTTVAVDLISIATDFALFEFLYSHMSTIAGWTKPQVYFFLGVFFASDALFSTFFMRNFWNFMGLVNKGELDILLTKPVSAVFLALIRKINLTSFFNVFLGVGVMIKFGEAAGFKGGFHWFSAVFWILFGVLAQALLRFFSMVWVFWTERGWVFSRLYYGFYQLASKPDAIFPSGLRFLLMTVLPFAFIGSVPARALLHGLSGGEVALVLLSMIFLWWINSVLWAAGLRRYTSASS